MPTFVERFWTADDGLRLHARDYLRPAGAPDTRLPVICIHGLTRNARDFEDVAPGLAAMGRRVLAVDVRGRGLSDYDLDPMRYVVPTYIADVLALARATGIARAAFVGTSMGGLITLGLAGMAPGLVASAVLNDIGPVLAPAGLARIAGYTGTRPQVSTWEEAAAYAAQVNGQAFPDYGAAEWAAFARRIFRKASAGLVLDYDADIAKPFAQAPATAPDMWPLFDVLARDRPLLLVHGERSDLLDAPTVAEMRRRAPAMTYAPVPRVGHAPMLTEPAAREALAAFFARVA